MLASSVVLLVNGGYEVALSDSLVLQKEVYAANRQKQEADRSQRPPEGLRVVVDARVARLDNLGFGEPTSHVALVSLSF